MPVPEEDNEQKNIVSSTPPSVNVDDGSRRKGRGIHVEWELLEDGQF